MNNMRWAIVIVAIVFAGMGFWGGMAYGQSKSSNTPASRFATGGTFAGRGTTSAGAGFGGGTFGTVVQVGSDSLTVQLPNSTSSSATTGTKLVLLSNSTQIDELQSVPSSNLQVGQTVIVAGASNSDGSITASSIMIRSAMTRGSGNSTGASK